MTAMSQGEQATPRLKSVTLGPRGDHRRAFEGPKIATVGAPTAAARCVIPLSLPMYRSLRDNNAAICAKFKFPATIKSSENLSKPPRSRSTGPRTTITLPPVRSRHHRPMLLKWAAGQFFSRAPLPGAITSSALFSSAYRAENSARHASASVASGMFTAEGVL